MMESWNIGIVGSGKMAKCIVGRVPSDKEIINGILPFKNQLSIIPAFHYSIVEAKI
jgi:hypothetical protein